MTFGNEEVAGSGTPALVGVAGPLVGRRPRFGLIFKSNLFIYT